MAKKRPRSLLGRHPVLFLSGLCTAALVCMFHYFLRHFYRTHFLPHTTIAELNISGLSLDEARSLVTPHYSFAPDSTLTIMVENTPFATSSASLGFHYPVADFLTAVLATQQDLSFLDFWAKFLTYSPYHYSSVYLTHDDQAVQHFLQTIDQQITTTGRQPSITLDDDGHISIDPGQRAASLDYQHTFASIQDNFPRVTTIAATLRISPEYVPLTNAQLTTLQTQAAILKDKTITLTTDSLMDYDQQLTANDFLPLLLPDSPARQAARRQLFSAIDTTVSRPPQEPVLTVDTVTMRATTFIPPLDGLTLDETHFFTDLTHALNLLLTSDETNTSVPLTLATTPPTRSLAQVNTYGINEVIGFGESYYDHSSAGRIHNVATAAKAINGVLVAPGEEFSFNKAVGEVSAATGYQQGYIIQGGRSVLSAGGGVCQVSTTVFRALLDSGLQITLRRPHSYRVTYYELSNDPGFDATVYTGNVDLRFINDTDHYVMITTHTDSQKLHMYVQIWGTSDGRYTTITDYKKYNAVGAPAPQYIEDPSLAPGQVKQIDWATGGLDTIFTHTIYNVDGSQRSQKQYPSHYQAWSAKYLVGPAR